MVSKLLRSNINRMQIAAYTISNIVGLIITGLALQFYRDVAPDSEQGLQDPAGNARYTILSHLASPSFTRDAGNEISQAEVNEIIDQPWAEDASTLTTAGFDISVSLDMGGRGFSTALFFEGVPRDYLDISPSEWTFDPARPIIPIILPRQYLALYNFGFAPARGLPVLDERTISMIPLNVTVSGNGKAEMFRGKIVGFSSRLNTIAVPDGFVTWGNERFSPTGQTACKRVIVKLRDPGNPTITDYLRSHNLEEADNNGSARLLHFVKIVAASVAAVGILICLLSLGLLILSVFLLLQRSRPTLAALMAIGYHPRQLAALYIKGVAMMNLVILLISSGGIYIISRLWQCKLSALGMDCSSVYPTIISITLLLITLTMLSAISIRHNVMDIWAKKRPYSA
ncbi:MAG: DUF2087 domain-containing protein [Muribaculaceae bacterium]|nr:DUF2087 domain-containing protein [Muribaculaceae bacterium]